MLGEGWVGGGQRQGSCCLFKKQAGMSVETLLQLSGSAVLLSVSACVCVCV